MAFSTMDSIQSSRLALIRNQQTPSIPPARPPPPCSHKGYTLNTTSTTQASSELSKHNVQNHGQQHLSVRLFFVMEGAGLSQENQEKREGGGEKEGGMNGGNTHLLFLRGSGKSFWKKDKEKGEKERSGTEKNQNTSSHVQWRKKRPQTWQSSSWGTTKQLFSQSRNVPWLVNRPLCVSCWEFKATISLLRAFLF